MAVLLELSGEPAQLFAFGIAAGVAHVTVAVLSGQMIAAPIEPAAAIEPLNRNLLYLAAN